MSVRQTSKNAYKQIKDLGLLGKKQFEVYSYLYENGPLTANEIFRGLKGMTTITQANIHARLNELKTFGSVIEVGKVYCDVTGRKVLQVDVTDKVPLKKRNKPTKDDIIKQQEKTIKRLQLALSACKCHKTKKAQDYAQAVLKDSTKKQLELAIL